MTVQELYEVSVCHIFIRWYDSDDKANYRRYDGGATEIADREIMHLEIKKLPDYGHVIVIELVEG